MHAVLHIGYYVDHYEGKHLERIKPPNVEQLYLVPKYYIRSTCQY